MEDYVIIKLATGQRCESHEWPSCGMERNFTTACAAVCENDFINKATVCENLQLHMRQNTESRHYTCGSMRKPTTAYAVVYGKSPLHIRHHADNCNSMCGIVQITNPALKAMSAYFKGHTRSNSNFLRCCDVQ